MPRKVVQAGVPNVTVRVSPSTESETTSQEKSEESASLSEEQRIADEAIEQSTAGAISRAVAWIWRIGKDGSKAYVGGVAPELVTNEFLLENCGGGEYHVDYRRPKKSGGTEQATARRFLVDPAVPPKIPPWAKVPVTTNGTPADPQARGNLSLNVIEAGILSAQQQQQQIFQQQQALLMAGLEQSRTHAAMQLELMRASLAAKPEPPPPKEDRTVELIAAVVTPVITAITGVITAVLQRPQPDRTREVIEIANALKPPPTPPADAGQLGSMISALNGLADLKDKIGGGNGSSPIDTGNPILDTVRDVARAIPEVASAARVAMTQRAANQPPPTETLQASPSAAQGALPAGERRPLSPGPGEPLGPPRSAVPAASPDVHVPEANGAQTEETMLRVFLKGISDEMLQHAKANRQPVRIAQAFLDLHEQYIEQIAWWVEQPGCVENFMKEFPEWREYKAWLEEFIQTIDKETHEAPQP